MNELTRWWLSYKELSEELLKKVNTSSVKHYKQEYDNWEYLTNELRKRVPISLNNHILYIEEKATNLIDKLFEKHVDKNTLVITSTTEHDSVEANLKNVKHKIRLNIESTDILKPVKNAIKQKEYKKVFVYIIGTNITTGKITPQQCYIDLKNYFDSINIPCIMVCDDVHGMYLIPRDYSIFDYVINTSHALIRLYDMGMLWSKTEENFGLRYDSVLKTYIELLDIILERKDKLSQWNNLMRNEFNDIVIKYPDYFKYPTDSVPHIFSIEVNCPVKFVCKPIDIQKWKESELYIETPDYEKSNNFFTRLRGAQFITCPSYLTEDIKIIRDLLNKVILINNIRGAGEITIRAVARM